jgi:hypothetical protein
MFHIVVTGNPVDGCVFFGPFQSDDLALAWAEKHMGAYEFWVAPINVPIYTEEKLDS